jgi:hypothetical protein
MGSQLRLPLNRGRGPVRPPLGSSKEGGQRAYVGNGQSNAGARAEHAQTGGAGATDVERFWVALRALDARRCLCGREKRRQMAFCGLCFHLLPEEMQKALYRKVGQGFEAAYVRAVDWHRRGLN